MSTCVAVGALCVPLAPVCRPVTAACRAGATPILVPLASRAEPRRSGSDTQTPYRQYAHAVPLTEPSIRRRLLAHGLTHAEERHMPMSRIAGRLPDSLDAAKIVKKLCAHHAPASLLSDTASKRQPSSPRYHPTARPGSSLGLYVQPLGRIFCCSAACLLCSPWPIHRARSFSEPNVSLHRGAHGSLPSCSMLPSICARLYSANCRLLR